MPLRTAGLRSSFLSAALQCFSVPWFYNTGHFIVRAGNKTDLRFSFLGWSPGSFLSWSIHDASHLIPFFYLREIKRRIVNSFLFYTSFILFFCSDPCYSWTFISTPIKLEFEHFLTLYQSLLYLDSHFYGKYQRHVSDCKCVAIPIITGLSFLLLHL